MPASRLGDLGFDALVAAKNRDLVVAQCTGRTLRGTRRKHVPCSTKLTIMKLLPTISRLFVHAAEVDVSHDCYIASSSRSSLTVVVRCPPCGFYHADAVRGMVEVIESKSAQTLRVRCITAYGFGSDTHFVGASVAGAIVVRIATAAAADAAGEAVATDVEADIKPAWFAGVESDLGKLNLSQSNKCLAVLRHLSRAIDEQLDTVHASLSTEPPPGCAGGSLFVVVTGPICVDLHWAFTRSDLCGEHSVYSPDTGELSIQVE